MQERLNTIWVHRDGYSIELTEEEVRKAYSQCSHPASSKEQVCLGQAGLGPAGLGPAVNQMTSDIYRLMDDINYAVHRNQPEPKGPFGY